jgi:hypothetical protein
MLGSRKLVLRKETLTELSDPELKNVAGASAGDLACVLLPPTVRTCVTCVDTLTIATCQCPAVTGATCVCPTEAVC